MIDIWEAPAMPTPSAARAAWAAWEYRDPIIARMIQAGWRADNAGEVSLNGTVTARPDPEVCRALRECGKAFDDLRYCVRWIGDECEEAADAADAMGVPADVPAQVFE
jgi:hypothetical protein